MKEKLKILVLLLILASQAYGQTQKKITGTVTDDKGQTLPGVTVVLVGTTQGVITDIEGKYTLNAAPGSQLKFSFIGFLEQTITVGKEMVINVQMLTDSKAIDEVVIVGYSSQTKKSVVGAISQTSGETLKSKGAVSNLTDALSGTIPGVVVMTKSGLPGSLGEHGNETTILIRGLSTWNNSAPLILIDGTERPMSDVSVDEIENFTVLKDASATAVFGVKGGNGVILITTKRGKTGKAKVTAEANFTMKSISKIEKPLGSYDALLARNWAIIHEFPISNLKMNKYASPRILGYYRDKTDPEKYTDVDWLDVMTKDQALSTKYNVNVSGGTEFVTYFTSLTYSTEGDIMNTGTGDNPRGYKSEFKYPRVNFRTNLDFNLTKNTLFKVNLSGYYSNQQTSGRARNAFWPGLYRYAPNTPLPIYEDGTFGADDLDVLNLMGNNHYFDLLTGGTSVTKRTALTSDFSLNQKLDFITKGLSARGSLSFDNYFTSQGSNVTDPSDYVRKRFDVTTNSWYYFIPAGGGNAFDFNALPIGYTTETPQSNQTRRNLKYELGFDYKRSFGKHAFEGLALFSREKNAAGSNWPSKREDWVGRIRYDYDGKYLFDVNGAYNGSEKFGPNYKFHFFPSLGLGWRISEEPFIKNNISKIISNLKIRYSIGVVGVDDLGANAPQWGYLSTWGAYNRWQNQVEGGFGSAFGTAIGGTNSIYLNQSFMENGVGNPDIRWESKRSQNYGIDLGLFNDLITGTVDYFREYRYDMLIGSGQRIAVPEFVGQRAPSVNAGEVKSSGVELEFKVNKTFGKVNLWGSYSWTLAKNEIIYMEDAELLPFYQKRAGYQIGQVTVQNTGGFISSWDELFTGVMADTPSGRQNTLTGHARLIDYNANGVIDTNDPAPYGYARQPQNTYSFAFGGAYKGLSLRVQFYGTYNTTINGGGYTSEEMMYGFPLAFQSLLERSAMPEYGVSDPTFRAFGIDRRGANGQYNFYDGSLLRLQTVDLSYTLPKKLLKAISFDNVRLFVTGNNLWLWNSLPVDTEGTDLGGEGSILYPNTKNINFGINVTL